MTIAAFVVAFMALGLAGRCWFRLDRLRRDFENYNPNPVYGRRRP